MTRRTAKALIALALAGGTTGAAATSASAAPGLIIRAGQHDVLFGTPVAIAGRLVGAPGGDAGHEVLLYADEFPFGDPLVVGSTTTAADGTYAFGVAPGRNAVYRTSAPDVPISSLATTVFAYPRQGLGQTFARGRLLARAVITGPPPVTRLARFVYFYFRPTGQRLFRRLATRQLAGPYGGSVRALASVVAPKTRGTLTYCTKVGPFEGMGRSIHVPDPRCGPLFMR